MVLKYPTDQRHVTLSMLFGFVYPVVKDYLRRVCYCDIC